ncbi:MAG TPA: hypothetical protein VGH13_23030 [Xanthobacteraceae bacterium]|jgi:hypothetical protein
MSPDLERFIEELQNYRDMRGAIFQAAWNRWAASTESALREIDKTADFDADTLGKLDEIRAIVRQRARPVRERLTAFQPILDALGAMADEKARRTAEQLRKLG